MSKIAHCDEFLQLQFYLSHGSRTRTVLYVTFDPKEKLIFSMMYVKHPNFAHYKIVSNTAVNPTKNGKNSFLFPLQDVSGVVKIFHLNLKNCSIVKSFGSSSKNGTMESHVSGFFWHFREIAAARKNSRIV